MDNKDNEIVYKTVSIVLFSIAGATFLFRNILATFFTYGNVANINWGTFFFIMMGFFFLLLHILEKTRLTNKAMMEKILEAIENQKKEEPEVATATEQKASTTENTETTKEEETTTTSSVNFTINTEATSSTENTTNETSDTKEETKTTVVNPKNDPFFASRIKEINL